MTRTSVADVPLGHPKDPWDLTEICTLFPFEPPKESKVCWVIVVSSWPESVNVVGNAFPFHMICDWGTKPLPFTVNRTDCASPGTLPGESEVIWGCGTKP